MRRYFSLSSYSINMKFEHDIPRVVRYTAMTFLSHPSCSSGSVYFSKTGKRQFLLTCKVSRYYLLALHDRWPILGTMVYMAGDSPSIARRANRAPLCAEWLHRLVTKFHNKNTFVQCFNSGPASQTVAQYKTNIVYLVESMLFWCWASVADRDTTLSQERYKSMCVLGTLNAFHLTNKYISISSAKSQWGLSEIWCLKSEV